MVAPLEGIRVVEVANWLAAPAAAGLMADLGADVIKVEPPGGDVLRGFIVQSLGYQGEFKLNPAVELDNRGKRSVTVSLNKPGGPELVRRLCAGADVFLTNLIQSRREKYGLGWDDVRGVNPRIVYLSFSGYGTQGPDAERAGFDYAAFWARSGIMGLLGDPASSPPLCRPAQGDHATALNILAATLAALRVRDATGEAQLAEVTLQGTGMWTIGVDIGAALMHPQQPPKHDRTRPSNPIWNSYRLGDGQWVLLVMPQPDPVYWPRFCRMVGREDWLANPEYGDVMSRRAHTDELTPVIEGIFAEHDLAYWSEQLDEYGLIWAPVAQVPAVVEDAQARAMGWFAELEHPEHGRYETLSTPFKVYAADIGPRGPAPAAGQHTFEVLAEMGIEGEELDRLVTEGVVG
jgi:crotonobetainyl-CoA:carnitine CoA-transferase CaiB-like acyl-CoA transferase